MGGSPLMIVVSAVFFGALKAGISALNYTTKLSSHFIEVLQGIVILLIAAPSLLGQFMAWLRDTSRKRNAHRQTRKVEEVD